MSKPQQNDDTLELDDILSQPVKDKERMAAFMMRKLAENKAPQNENLFGNFKVDFNVDFEVPLIKKPKPKPKTPETQKQPLRELPSSAPEQANKPPVDQASSENQPQEKSPALSPIRRHSLRRSGNVPGSDKLRRHAIRRRSRSCGRQLLPEFDEASNLTRSFSSPVNFMPGVSSTPCAEKPNEKAEMPAEEIAKDLAGKQTEEPTTNQAEQPAEKHLQPEVKSPARTSSLANEIAQICKERQSSFHNNVLQLDYSGRAPYSRPDTPPSPSVALRRTYTMENGPAPGQLLLSPSQRNCVVKLKKSHQEIVVPNTPPPPSYEPAWQSQPQPDFVVPETQPQDLGELVQTLSRSVSSPIVVINAANPNLSVRRDSLQVGSLPASPVAATSSIPAASSAKRPAAISSPKHSAAVPSPKPKGLTPRTVENVDAIMTDDDSDEQPSTVALNLAPPGGNTTRQRRLRSYYRDRVTGEAQESSMRLLNLHRSVNANAKKSRGRKTNVQLNKAPSAPINGEQFAIELTRMSNYEILDLRKRNSLNEVYPLDGHRKPSSEEKDNLEERIQRELERRKIMDVQDGLPGKPSSTDSEDSVEWVPLPRKKPGRGKSKEIPNRRSRSQRRELPMSKELQNYLRLSSTMETRRKLSREGKRSLYTKGDSNVEDFDSSSPVKLPRLSRSIQIVPPPPLSLRYSQSMQCERRSRKFDFDDVVMSAPPEFHDKPSDDTIEIAPPPPQYVVNTRMRSTFGRKSNKEDLVSPPQEYEGQNGDVEQPRRSHAMTKPSLQFNSRGRRTRDNEVVPPPLEYIEPPEYVENGEHKCNDEQQMSLRCIGKKSVQSYPTGQETRVETHLLEYSEALKPAENDGDDSDDEQPRRSQSKGKKSQRSETTERNAKKDKVVPPPLEYNETFLSNSKGKEAKKVTTPPEFSEPLEPAENDGDDSDNEQPRRSQSKGKKSQRSETTERNAQKDKVVSPPFESNETSLSNPKGKGTRKDTTPPEFSEPLEPAENDGDDSDNEQPRRAQFKGKKSQRSETTERNAQKDKVVPTPLESNETLLSNPKGKGAKKVTTPPEFSEQLEPAENDGDDSDNEQPRRAQFKGKKSQRSETTERNAKKDKVVPPPLEYIETTDRLSRNLSNGYKSAPADAIQAEETIEKSEHMESLRVNTPTPPPDPKARDVPSNSRSAVGYNSEDDVPSTSRTALEALQRSQQESKTQPQIVSNADVVFKKPTAPAPKAKKPKKTEVDKLKLRKLPVEMDEDDINTSGIRRSKRGHVPLQNTWCHTMDPRTFSFMRDFLEPPSQNSKLKKANTSKAKKTSVTQSMPTLPQNSSVSRGRGPVVDRGPLCSSTPRNPETGLGAIPNSESLGVTPLIWEDTPVQAVSTEGPRKRGRPRKREEVVQSETETEPEPVTATEPEPVALTPSRNGQQEPFLYSITPARDEQEEASIRLMNWLRGVGNAHPTGSMADESASVSPANDLVFSKVDGIDYAFYKTKDKASLGYMRFQPHQARNKKRAKVYALKFIVQFGEFAVQTIPLGEEEETAAILCVGDMIEIDRGRISH
ncbi:hypothetical protein M5D96_002240 [Drosophila gunungcola]|uniref:Uncharacterized protein n=1 Tax=Drosophila gunungcola TaxID=103775 RepID=A0A9Q0BW36_9MUSC|nr:hypothetical protein M5D96_002240 [Drosophila gunungcola]